MGKLTSLSSTHGRSAARRFEWPAPGRGCHLGPRRSSAQLPQACERLLGKQLPCMPCWASMPANNHAFPHKRLCAEDNGATPKSSPLCRKPPHPRQEARPLTSKPSAGFARLEHPSRVDLIDPFLCARRACSKTISCSDLYLTGFPSAFFAISPPTTPASRTSWLLPNPPNPRLHDIGTISSRLAAINTTFAPMLSHRQRRRARHGQTQRPQELLLMFHVKHSPKSSAEPLLFLTQGFENILPGELFLFKARNNRALNPNLASRTNLEICLPRSPGFSAICLRPSYAGYIGSTEIARRR